MPRASWRGFLRLSAVTCPIYLAPATTRTKPIRLLAADNTNPEADQSRAAGVRIHLPPAVSLQTFGS